MRAVDGELRCHAVARLVGGTVIGVDGRAAARAVAVEEPVALLDDRLENSSMLSTPLDVCIQPARSLKPW